MELTKTFQKIATGNAVVYGGASGYLELWAKYNSQDIPNNRTNVTVELRLVVTHGYIGNYQATYWNINGDLSKSGNLGSGDYRSRILGSVTGDIAHNLDGTKTISFSGEFNPTAWGYSMKVEGDATLPTLHTPPEITSVDLVENNTKLTNLSVPNDTIVQYLSNKTFTINATYDDATISNCSIYHNNVLIGTSATNEVVVDFSKVSELITTETNGTHYVGLTIAVTDSKSGYSTRIFNFPVIKYTRPTIEKTSTTIKRKTGWSEQQQKNLVLTDNFGVLNFVGTCYKGNDVIGNANKPTVQYKIWNTTEPSYSTLTTPNTANVTIKDYEISDILYTSTYNYKIKIYDTFTTIETTINVKVDKVPTGVSVWTEYKDRVNFIRATIDGKDIVESGENDNGSWVKYYDGTMICTKKLEGITNNVSKAWGNLYESQSAIDLGSMPETFTELKYINASLTSNSWHCWIVRHVDTGASNFGKLYLARPTTANVNVNINCLAIGKWK